MKVKIPRLGRLALTLAAAVSVSLLTGGCRGVPDLPEAKRRVMAYYEDGRHERDMAREFARARAWLPPEGAYNIAGSAVVMDIDDTVLDTYEYQKALGFGHYGKAWHEWIEMRRAKAIAPALDFYNLARARGLAVFFVTGRREAFRLATEENLRAVGFADWKGLLMKPTDFRGKSVVELKTAARREIERRGYRILINIGDQTSDLEGGHAVHRLLLPNPIYGVH